MTGVDVDGMFFRFRHSHEGGNPWVRQQWIPAFAGMTACGAFCFIIK
jgi:hypothetical protein